MNYNDIMYAAFYDELDADEKKKFSNYLMIRWGSAVDAGHSERDKLIAQYYLQNCNENFNKHFFTINKHPKLQWLCATTVSPDDGAKRHSWIAPKKKVAGESAKRKSLQAIYPHYKDDEIEVMMRITTQKEIDEYHRAAGNDTK